jgi:hypothetical protein
MSYTYIQERQAVNGFVFTIDGHLVYGVPTSIVPDINNQPATLTQPFSWRIAQPTYFYDNSRSSILDRTGSFVKILNTNIANPAPVPLATCILLKADTSNFITLKVLFLESGATLANLDLSETLSIALWDNYKFCSRVPSWIPAGAESRDRWIPILADDFQFTIGQNIDLKGGFGSVDGVSIPMVADTRYQTLNRLQRIFREDASAYTFNNPLTGDTFPTLTEEHVDPAETSVDISVRPLASVSSIPIPWDEYPNYPWVSATITDTELQLIEPIFIDTEALIPTDRVSFSPGINGTLYRYYMIRAVDGSFRSYHSKYSVIYDGMPFPIGQGCKVYELNNLNSTVAIASSNLYRGLVENISLDDGLAGLTIEVSSITFTPRVNTEQEKDLSVFTRVNQPGRGQEGRDGDDFSIIRFYNKFIASQINLTDNFSWVKIGGLALPIIQREPIDYIGYLEGDNFVRTLYLTRWGITSDGQAEGNLQSNFSSGTTDIGYTIGFYDIFENPIEVAGPSLRAFESPYTVQINNWFLTSSLVDGEPDSIGPSILPTNSPWGFYILDKPDDVKQHDLFQFVRTFEALLLGELDGVDVAADVRKFNDYISDEEAILIHMFEPFTRGKLRSAYAPGTITRKFYYETDSLTRRNYSLCVNLIDVILQVLTSTGDGGYEVVAPGEYKSNPGVNGAWDLIPSELGMGIPIAEIDLNSFLDVLNKRGVEQLLVSNIYIEQEDNPQEFLEDEILKPYFLSIATNSQGKIILIDTADARYGIDNINIFSDQFVKVKGERTRVSLSYEAQDLVDSFTYNWYQPWIKSWYSPSFTSKERIQGNAAINTQITVAGRPYNIGSKTSIFKRIQSSPIDFELRYTPNEGEAITPGPYGNKIVTQALTYLERYNRIVPRATFELFWDPDAILTPDIGNTITFNLDAIPDVNGIIGNPNKILVGKVVDIKIDRIGKTARYEAIITDSSLADLDLVWNLTAELVATLGADRWTIEDNFFCFNNSSLIGPDGNPIFEFDGSQFLVGSTIIVWDKNWRYVTDTFIVDVDIDPNTREINYIEVDNDTDFQTGHRITLETINNTTSPYKEFLSWLNINKKFL